MGEVLDAILAAKAAQQRAALAGLNRYLVQLEIPTATEQHSVLVNLIIKASDQDAAKEFVKDRMLDWCDESPLGSTFLEGDLLSWNYYTPKVVNGA